MSSKPIEDKIVSIKMDISDLRSKVGETVKIFSTLNGALTSTKTLASFVPSPIVTKAGSSLLAASP